tara:strand:- start:3774 stop:3962 length:189 start_codon:yes stop_codon:yes gene_type:complete
LVKIFLKTPLILVNSALEAPLDHVKTTENINTRKCVAFRRILEVRECTLELKIWLDVVDESA